MLIYGQTEDAKLEKNTRYRSPFISIPLILNKNAVIKLAAFFCSSLYMKMKLITFNEWNGVMGVKIIKRGGVEKLKNNHEGCLKICKY